MTSLAQICFWVGAACVAYVYLLYPLAVYALARTIGARLANPYPPAASISVIITARDEADGIAGRINEFRQLMLNANVRGEIIVACNGSTDATAEIARGCGGADLKVLEIKENVGKAAALTQACSVARGQVLVFADVRQYWRHDALRLLLENFRDARIGAATGELILQAAPGVMTGVGLYWRYERWIRRHEGLLWSTVGVTGAICAVRRELFTPIPIGTILDDVYWPLCVCMRGKRVVHDPRALAFDYLPQRARDEFRRKVRTLSGNFQLLGRLPQALLPWRNPIWLQLISHKFLRLLVPWMLLMVLLASLLIDHWFYRIAVIAQLLFYSIALVGIFGAARLRLASAAASFVVLNAAAWTAFWIFITGRSSRSWTKVHYAAT